MSQKPQLPIITSINKKSPTSAIFIFMDKLVVKCGNHIKEKKPIDSIEYIEDYHGDMAHVTEPIKGIW